MFSSITRAVGTCRSMNVACAAPRLSASSPSAPVPANRSRACLPFGLGAHKIEDRLAQPVLHRPGHQLVVLVRNGSCRSLRPRKSPADDPQFRGFGQRLGAAAFGTRHTDTAE